MLNINYIDSDNKLIDSASTIWEQKIIGVDIETTNVLKPRHGNIRLIQLGGSDVQHVLDLFYTSSELVKSVIAPILLSTKTRKVIHNFKFEHQWFLHHFGIRAKAVFDTQIAHTLLEFRDKHGLAATALKYLGTDISKAMQMSDWSVPVLSTQQLEYAATDVRYLPDLRKALLQELTQTDQLKAFTLEMEALPIISEMELNGLPMDREKFVPLIETFHQKKHEVGLVLSDYLESYGNTRPLKKATTFSLFDSTPVFLATKDTVEINSNAQVTERLQALGVPIMSTSAKEIKPIADQYESVKLLLDYRKYAKLCSSFGTTLLQRLENGRLYGNFNPLGTVTYRLSSSSPNQQQMPNTPEFRGCFAPKAGRKFVISDFSGFEMRILAEFSGDAVMLDAFANGKDLHSLTCANVFKVPYEEAKTTYKKERLAAKICFSGDTEILTRNGWIRFDKYDKNTEVCQFILPDNVHYNPEHPKSNRWGHPTGKQEWNGRGFLKFVKPVDFQKVPNQRLVHQQDRNTDMLMTENHQVVFVDANNRARKVAAKDVTAGNIKYVPCGGKLLESSTCELSELETRFLAMFVQDGSYNLRRGECLRFGFKKARKITRCKTLLDSLGLSYKQSLCGTKYQYTSFVVRLSNENNKLIFHKILKYCNPKTKVLYTHAAFELNPEIYLEESAHWDGHKLKTSNRGRVLFSSTVKETVDTMQMMCAFAEYQSRMSEKPFNSKNTSGVLYTLSWRTEKLARHSVSWNLKDVGKITDVYCVQVPSEAILVRRNGKIFVSGNCNFSVIYGISPPALVSRLKADGLEYTEEEAKDLIKGFYNTYKGARRWLFDQEKAIIQNRTIVGLAGHKIKIQFDPRDKQSLNNAKREARNFPIQHCNSVVIKTALTTLHAELLEKYPTAKIVNCIHDEIIVECDDFEAQEVSEVLERNMVSAGEVFLKKVKVVADAAVCDSWADKA